MVRIYTPQTSDSNRNWPPNSNGNNDTQLANSLPNGWQGSSSEWGSTRTVTVGRSPGASLGLSIVGGKIEGTSSTGLFIKSIRADGPAARNGLLNVGDRLIAIDEVQLSSADHNKAVEAIRNAGNVVTFIVQTMHDDDNHENNNRAPGPLNIPVPAPRGTQIGDHGEQHQLLRPSEDRSPSMVSMTSSRSSVRDSPPGSPEIIQTGLSDFERQALQQKLQAELQAQREKHLTVYQRAEDTKKDDDDPNDEEGRSSMIKLSNKENKVERKEDVLKGVEEGREQEEEEEEEDDKNEEEYAEERINQMENFKVLKGQIIEVELTKEPKVGLGIALAGHKARMRMATFICGINPDGPAFKTGKLRPGDEVLKVHKSVVRGRCHLNVSAIIGKLPEELTFRIIVLRPNDDEEDNEPKSAVTTVPHFPTFLDHVIFGAPEFEEFVTRREIKMQKTTEGLGLMIIEGAHKLLGKGIFVSDLQQNSLAFRAQVRVGDKLLACNTESFLKIGHDEASRILKQSTGNVRLLVVNPADESSARSANSKGKRTSVGTVEPIKIEETKKEEKESNKVETIVEETPVEPPEPPFDGKIELKKEANKALGFTLVGGKLSPIKQLVVHEVLQGGLAGSEGRLRVGDRLLSVNGVNTKEMELEEALKLLRGIKDKCSLQVERPSKDLYCRIEVTVTRSAGKTLGFSVAGFHDGPGAFVNFFVPKGVAELDGQLSLGDRIVSVNGADVREKSVDEIAAAIKLANPGAVKINLERFATD